jgi:ubiquitin C-terminal hydrolase
MSLLPSLSGLSLSRRPKSRSKVSGKGSGKKSKKSSSRQRNERLSLSSQHQLQQQQQQQMQQQQIVQQQRFQLAFLEVGLENLGNTCFMNSSLQCLLHIEPLVSFFLANDIDSMLNVRSPMRGLLAKSFASLTRELATASAGSSIAPVNFQRVVSV